MDVSVLRGAPSFLGGLSTALDSKYPVNPIQLLGHSSAVSVAISVSMKPNQKVYVLLRKLVTIYAVPTAKSEYAMAINGKTKGLRTPPPS